MLRTNLSTRPFYNERGVHWVLGALALIGVVLTVFNLGQIVMLSRRQSQLGTQAEAAETRAQELRARAARTRQVVNPGQLEEMSEAAREANEIIGHRLFSWTGLLNRLETTLPENVRITSLRPRVVAAGDVRVLMNVSGRTAEDIELFMVNLEKTGAFADVIILQETSAEDDGVRQATVEGKYAPAP